MSICQHFTVKDVQLRCEMHSLEVLSCHFTINMVGYFSVTNTFWQTVLLEKDQTLDLKNIKFIQN